VFLEVASVVNQYALQGVANEGLGWSQGLGNSQNVGVAGQYSDWPTIADAPLTGQHHVRSLLTPVPPASIVAMVQAGRAVGFVFRLAVRSINGVSSSGALGAKVEGKQGADYYDVLAALRRLHLSVRSARVSIVRPGRMSW